MHSKQNTSIALLKEEDVQDIEFGGDHFLFFYIPRVDRSFRPVFQGLDPRTGTFRRDIEGDYRCTPEEVNSMFADANIVNPADGRILKNYGKEDLDEQSIKQYRRKFEQYNPDNVWNTLSEDEFLRRIKSTITYRQIVVATFPSQQVTLKKLNFKCTQHVISSWNYLKLTSGYAAN